MDGERAHRPPLSHGHDQVTRAALQEMGYPGVLATGLPVVVGLVFRFIGALTGRPLLGAEALAGYLMFGTVTGIMMALFLDNGTRADACSCTD